MDLSNPSLIFFIKETLLNTFSSSLTLFLGLSLITGTLIWTNNLDNNLPSNKKIFINKNKYIN